MPFEESLEASSIIFRGRYDEGKTAKKETDDLDTGHDIDDAGSNWLPILNMSWICREPMDFKKG